MNGSYSIKTIKAPNATKSHWMWKSKRALLEMSFIALKYHKIREILHHSPTRIAASNETNNSDTFLHHIKKNNWSAMWDEFNSFRQCISCDALNTKMAESIFRMNLATHQEFPRLRFCRAIRAAMRGRQQKTSMVKIWNSRNQPEHKLSPWIKFRVGRFFFYVFSPSACAHISLPGLFVTCNVQHIINVLAKGKKTPTEWKRRSLALYKIVIHMRLGCLCSAHGEWKGERDKLPWEQQAFNAADVYALIGRGEEHLCSNSIIAF